MRGDSTVRRNVVASTGTVIAMIVLLSACGSSSKDSTADSPTSAATTSGNVLTCKTFFGKLTLDPPIAPGAAVTHKINVTGKLSDCTGSSGITSGEVTSLASVTDKLDCEQLATYKQPNKSAAISITWSNGKRSIGSGFVVSFERVTSFLISGKFDAGGEFVNRTATLTTQNTRDKGCTGNGDLETATMTLKPGTSFLVG
jgi:hypothetical protein